jgi:hypothetical protein
MATVRSGTDFCSVVFCSIPIEVEDTPFLGGRQT